MMCVIDYCTLIIALIVLNVLESYSNSLSLFEILSE